MPELPEVESVVQDLRPELIGKIIRNVDILLPRIIQNDAEYFLQNVVCQEIVDVCRRGKYILIVLKNGKTMVVHLRMTGALMFLPKHQKNEETHLRVSFDLDEGSQLLYSDTRTFGTIQIISEQSEIPSLFSLGPEPLEDSFHGDYLYSQLHSRQSSVKSILLNQEIIAGLGNIYVDESLFRAKIRPSRLGGTIKKSEAVRLSLAIKETISQALGEGGTTFRDYRNGKGEKGSFQDHLYVYGRGNQPCIKCGSPISKIKIAGRGTHYCVKCQK